MACEKTLWDKIKQALDLRRSQDLIDKVAQVDQQNREVKHDLRNLAQRTDALRHLVQSMREDETWRRETPHGH